MVDRIAYRPDEALEVLPVGRTALYELLKSGAIPSFKSASPGLSRGKGSSITSSARPKTLRQARRTTPPNAAECGDGRPLGFDSEVARLRKPTARLGKAGLCQQLIP